MKGTLTFWVATAVVALVFASLATADRAVSPRPPQRHRAAVRINHNIHGNPDPCIDNITNAAGQVAAAIVDVVRAVGDCPNGNRTAQCVADVAACATHLAQAAADIATAVPACGGVGSKCATDVLEVGKEIADAARRVAQALADCGDKQDAACIEQVILMAGDVEQIVSHIRMAVTDCRSPK